MPRSKSAAPSAPQDENPFAGFGQTTGKPEKIRVLSCGKSKSGKTTFALSFPKPFIIDADLGLAGASAGAPYVTVERWTPETRNHPYKTTNDVISVINDLRRKDGSTWEYLSSIKYVPETLVIDSISALSDVLESEVIMNPPDGKQRDETLFISDYNTIQRRMFTIIRAACSLDMHVVVTAEIEWETDEANRRFESPSVTGRKLGPRLPHFFDEVYRHVAEKQDDGTVTWTLSPQPTRDFPFAGSRFGLDRTIDNPTFAAITKEFN